MKITAFLSAALLATGTIAATAVPTAADAQRQGWHGRDDGPRGYRGGGWRGDRGWRGNRGWRGDRWGRGPGWHRGPGWRDGNRYGGYRGRVVCRVRPGYYGPVRTCFRR